jgi:hypothetical protein
LKYILRIKEPVMTLRTILVAAIFMSLTAGLAAHATAQTSVASADKTKKEALEWLERFARFQVLFHADDVKKLQERVAAMSPEEAAGGKKRLPSDKC